MELGVQFGLHNGCTFFFLFFGLLKKLRLFIKKKKKKAKVRGFLKSRALVERDPLDVAGRRFGLVSSHHEKNIGSSTRLSWPGSVRTGLYLLYNF